MKQDDVHSEQRHGATPARHRTVQEPGLARRQPCHPERVDDLTVSGSCGTSGFHRFLTPRAFDSHLTFDLRRMRFAEPLGIVAIASLADRATSEGERLIVLGPDDPNIANFLARMRLGSVLAGMGVEHDLPDVREHDIGDALFELSQFRGARGAGQLAEHVHDAVSDPDAADALYAGVVEAGQNVAHHSGRPHGFVAAAKTHSHQRLYFAVGDAGAGMLATLSKRGAKDDKEALKLALTPGVSGTGDPSRGNGLSDTLDQIAALGGNLHVLSGRATVTASHGSRSYAAADRLFPGTVVQGYIPLA